MLQFQEEVLREQLSQLSAQARVAFAASCAQRLTGVYRAFAERSGQSGATVESALEYVWSHIWAGSQEKQTEEILAQVMASIPDEETPGWTALRAYAEDAASAVAYSLRCLLSHDSQEAAWAARCVYEALDHLVISRTNLGPSDPDAENQILGDPLIQAELERQERDMRDLRSARGSLPPSFLESFRVRSTAEQAIVL